MKNFIQPGRTLDMVATAAVSSGDVVQVGELVGVANADAAIGESYALDVEGVFEVAKADAQEWTVGAPIYFDAGAGEATTDDNAGANAAMGHAVVAVANTAGLITGLVRLSN